MVVEAPATLTSFSGAQRRRRSKAPRRPSAALGAAYGFVCCDARLMRGDGPTVFTSVREGRGVDDVVDLILAAWRMAGSPGKPGAVPEE